MTHILLYIDQYVNVWMVLITVSLFLFSSQLITTSSVDRFLDPWQQFELAIACSGLAYLNLFVSALIYCKLF